MKESQIQIETVKIGKDNRSRIAESQQLIEQTLIRLGERLQQGFSEEMRYFLKAMAYFHSDSFGNQILILSQNPTATHVAGFRTWNRLNRFVKRGEKGIAILAPWIAHHNPKGKSSEAKPSNEEEQKEAKVKEQETWYLAGFHMVHVFDVSQTLGEPLPQPTQAAGDTESLIPLMESAIRGRGIQLEYGNTGSAVGYSQKARSSFNPGWNPRKRFRPWRMNGRIMFSI